MVPRWIARRWIAADDPHPRVGSGCDGFAEPGESGFDRLPEPVAIVDGGGSDFDRPARRADVSKAGAIGTAGPWIPAPDRVQGRLPDRGPGHAFEGMRLMLCGSKMLRHDVGTRVSAVRCGGVGTSAVRWSRCLAGTGPQRRRRELFSGEITDAGRGPTAGAACVSRRQSRAGRSRSRRLRRSRRR